ncbi:MAG: right-handed parallel beta-helix repeat-containing protein [Tannerella sp.]|nr:right-handed parallel beta-helix repeat-containing protein [Tannerella sp.]
MNKIYILPTLLLSALSICISQAQTQYYVSPHGNDAGNGSAQFPFRTIAQALEAARPVEGDVTVFLRGGVYRLRETLVLTPQDGGAGKSLTVRAYGDEKAVIKGSVALDGLRWTPYRGGILKTEVSGNPQMDMLIVNGEIRPQARYPDFDSTAIRFNGTAADATSPRRVKRWKNPAGGYLHAMHGSDWGDFHYRITGKDRRGRLETEGGWQNNRRSGLHAANRMVENIFEELDAPGEWFYSAAESMLYYYPLPGEDVTEALFESPQLKSLIEIRGSEAEPVRRITVEGVDLTQTVRTFMEAYEPLLRSDWTIYRGAAVFFEGAERCALKNCNLYNLGGNAVFFSNYNRRCEVSGSHFTRIGAGAVCFVGDPGAVRSPSFEYAEFVPPEEMDRAKGPKGGNYPADCRVHDNLIHKIGLYEKQIAGVELSMCRAVTVSRNSIYDTPRAGINVSEGTWGGHVIEFNDVFDTVKETGDHGSFNSWGRDRFWHPQREVMDSLLATGGYAGLVLADATETTVIRNNRFRCDRGWDIDLDDGSSNYIISNNLCLNGGLKLREGFYRVVENNILVNGTWHRHVWFKQSGVVFIRNIVMAPYEQTAGCDMSGALIDGNVFTDSLSYRTARSFGSDASSVVCRVAFTDPASGDFRVADTLEEVFRTGFQNFAMDRFGVESPRLKALAGQPRMPAPVFAADGGTDAETFIWESVQVKNLNTLGERSATGMDSERGVYVVAVSAWGSELRDFLRSNDVIVGFAGMPVNSIDDLRRAVAGADLSKPQQMTVFRNQRENTVTVPGGVIRANVGKKM